MQNTTIVRLSIDLMYNLSYKVLTNWTLTGFTFPPEIIFKITHTSIDMHSSCRIPLLCDCLSIWCAIWATKWLQRWHSRVLIFSPNSFAFIKFNYTDLRIRLFIMMYLHAWSKGKLISWALFVSPIMMRSSNQLTNMWWIDLRSWIESIQISIFITINMGFKFFPFIWEY